MTTNISIGKIGEDLACGYLIKNGYRVLARNHREGWDEIDIIGRAKNGTLIFFEVKTISGEAGSLMPEDNMTSAKVKKLKRACQMFVAKQSDLINNNVGWRIDLLAITITGHNPAKDHIMRHYENI